MRWRVVVVDDLSEVRSLMSMLLSSEPDFEVVDEAADGREAIEVVGRAHPDLVLIDWNMPVMDGLAALPEIRCRFPGTAIVMMSSSGSGEIERLSKRAGADGFVSKLPDSISKLSDNLRTVMSSVA